MTESPCRLIECIYLNKAGISKGCTVSYPANGWVLNNGLVEDLVKERKKDRTLVGVGMIMKSAWKTL